MNYRQQIAAADPIRYIGSEKADIRFYDGALKHAVGAKHYQVVRANREFPETQEDYGWTYNHAPMLCWWNGHFWIEYLSNPVSEHEPPSHTLLTWSRDGEEWVKPVVIFPSLYCRRAFTKGRSRNCCVRAIQPSCISGWDFILPKMIVSLS